MSKGIYEVITNDVSDYLNLLVRIAHIICNHPLYLTKMQNGQQKRNNTLNKNTDALPLVKHPKIAL
jgi:hypothetical protein